MRTKDILNLSDGNRSPMFTRNLFSARMHLSIAMHRIDAKTAAARVFRISQPSRMQVTWNAPTARRVAASTHFVVFFHQVLDCFKTSSSRFFLDSFSEQIADDASGAGESSDRKFRPKLRQTEAQRAAQQPSYDEQPQ